MLDGDKFIIISFENGGGGHKLGRILCCLPDIYWYSHPSNGIRPWNVHFTHTDIRQRRISKFHFDRITPAGMLPPTHDYIKNFIPDEDEYYEKHYMPAFEKAGGLDILKTHKLLLVSHALPETLLTRFPKAVVLNVVDDADQIAERYLKTTALFPAHLKLKWIDGENTDYGRKLQTIADHIGKDFTVRDVWAYNRYQTKYTNDLDDEYREHVFEVIHNNISIRKTYSHNNCLTVSKRDYKKIKEFLNARR
jgi:hypothetical protein